MYVINSRAKNSVQSSYMVIIQSQMVKKSAENELI